jgi:hypothetical protein
MIRSIRKRRTLVQVALGLGGASLWLLLLEATDFNAVAVATGLLVALAIIR